MVFEGGEKDYKGESREGGIVSRREMRAGCMYPSFRTRSITENPFALRLPDWRLG